MIWNYYFNDLGVIYYIAFLFGPGFFFSKLTTSLFKGSLTLLYNLKLISQIHSYFLLNKCKNLLNCKRFSHFPTKNNVVFAYVVGIYLTS